MKHVSLMTALVACLLVSINSIAARSPRMKDEVAKIAVGPAPVRTPAAIASEDEDPTDAVDKPIRKPKVTVSDAPRADVPAEVAAPTIAPAAEPSADEELTAAAAAAPVKKTGPPPITSATKPTAKATNGRPVRDEGSISIHGVAEPAAHVDDGAGDDKEDPTAKIDTSKPKAEPFKPTTAPAPVRVQKPGKVPATVDGFVNEPEAKTDVKASPKAVEGVTADQSMKWLENGNVRYTTHKYRADGRGEKDRAKKDVKPHAIVLACSDSRVPPELIFDQGLGEITTIRVAGEVLDSSVIASIEQTIMNDHPHLLVVLGHTQCSSIEQALNWKDTPSFGSDALDRMVSEIKPHLKTANTTKSPGFQIESALQADGVARDLPEHSAIIKKAVDSGELTIKTGLYWTDTGKVKFY